MNNKIKTYSELIQYSTYEDRLKYLMLYGIVGEDTFGFDRYLNQIFYKSEEWKRIRDYVIARDNGCDLGDLNHKIFKGIILIHHMNPLTKDDIINKTRYLLDPEYLITTTLKTHNIIHYSYEYSDTQNIIVERKQYDTCPWKLGGIKNEV